MSLLLQEGVFGALPLAPSVPRPLKTYIPSGDIQSAWKSEDQPYANVRSRRSAAQRAGLAYQKRVGNFLSDGNSEWSVVHGPWYCFHDASLPRHYCQPDFLLMDDRKMEGVIIEVKIRWTSDAWWQLRRLYLPVLRAAHARWNFSVLCICKSYDPAIPCGEEVNLIDKIDDCRDLAFNVMVLK